MRCKRSAHGKAVPRLSLWCSKQLLCELYLSIVSDLTCLSVTASHRRSSLGETERGSQSGWGDTGWSS